MDEIFDGLCEPVLVDLVIRSYDAALERQAVSKYSRRLKTINRSMWDVDCIDGLSLDEGLDGKPSWKQPKKRILRPFHRRDPIAEEVLRDWRKIQDSMKSPTLLFQTRVMGRSEHLVRLVAEAIGGSAFQEGMFRVVAYHQSSPAFQSSMNASRDMTISTEAQCDSVWNESFSREYASLKTLGHIASAAELQGWFRPMLAGTKPLRTIRSSIDPPAHPSNIPSLLLGEDWDLSRRAKQSYKHTSFSQLFNGGDSAAADVRLPLDLLKKHVFVAGIPGKGKTVALLNILIQLLKQGIPFLVFEPVSKTEHRILTTLTSHPDTEIQELARRVVLLTPGKESISPMRFNPLWRPKGIGRDEHISNLVEVFAGALPMFPALPYILTNALQRIYASQERNGRWPTLADVLESAVCVLTELGYSGETFSDIKGALQSRLGGLTNLCVGEIFRGRYCIPEIDELLSKPVIVEIGNMSQDQSSLFVLFLLNSIREYIKSTRSSGQGLRHVIVIEEAHGIVGSHTDASPSEIAPDPRSHATQFLSRILAEFRALGEGVIIADQSPAIMAPEIIRYTGTKLVFCLVAADDRSQMGNAMLFGDREYEEVARFLPGEAYLFSEGYYAPQKIRTLNVEEILSLKNPPLGEEILPYIQDNDWFLQLQQQRRFRDICGVRERLDDIEYRIQHGMKECQALQKQLLRAMHLPDAESRAEMQTRIICSLNDKSAQFDHMKENLQRQSIFDILLPVREERWEPEFIKSMEEFQSHLQKRISSHIQPLIQNVQRKIQKLIDECNHQNKEDDRGTRHSGQKPK